MKQAPLTLSQYAFIICGFTWVGIEESWIYILDMFDEQLPTISVATV